MIHEVGAYEEHFKFVKKKKKKDSKVAQVLVQSQCYVKLCL